MPHFCQNTAGNSDGHLVPTYLQVHVRSVLRALGCNDKAAFDDLLEALTEKEQPQTSGVPESDIGDEHREWVHPAKVLERLRQFVEAENSEAMDGAVLSGPLPSSNRPSKVAGVTRRQVIHFYTL